MTLTASIAGAEVLRRWGIEPTPLVSLKRLAPPGVQLYAKCEWHLPTGSVKDRIAVAMIEAADLQGALSPDVRLLEPSSGNTGIALARIARLRDLRLTVVLPENVSQERTALLEAYGAELVLSPGSEGSNGAVRRAEELRAEGGFVLLHQYENPANPGAHEVTTGPEIVAQLRQRGIDRLDAFVATLGTGGTLMGVGRALRRHWPHVQVVAAEPPAGELIAGLRSLDDGYIPPIFDPSRIDRKLLVRTGDAIKAMRRLMSEEGLFVGPSSGAAVHATLRVASKLEPGAVVVTVLPDAGWKYLSAGIFSGPLSDAERRAAETTLW